MLDAIEELSPLVVVLGSHGRAGVSRAHGQHFRVGHAAQPRADAIVPAPERSKIAQRVAWRCRRSRHILVDGESTGSCAAAQPILPHWLSAAVTSDPVDIAEPSVGEGAATGLDATQTTALMFVTSPAGSYDRSTPNAEIRIRRF